MKQAIFVLWFFFFFTGLGLIVPQFSPFVYSFLNLENPGLIFLVGQLTLPLGSIATGYISDRTLLVRIPLVVLTLSAALSIAIFSQARTFSCNSYFEIYCISSWALFTASMGGIMPLINVAYLQSGCNPNQFGLVRMSGTIGFMVPNALIAFTDLPGKIVSNNYFLPASILLLISTIFAFLVPRDRTIEEREPRVAVDLHGALSLVRSKQFIIFLLVMLIFYIGFSTSEYVITDFLSRIPFYFDPVGFSWLIGPGLEVVFFIFSPWLLNRFGSVQILQIAFLASIARYGGMLLLPYGPALVYLQVLHGIHFSPAHLGYVIHLKERSPPRLLGTANALFLVFSRSLGLGVGAYFFGNMARSGHFDYAFFGAAIAGLVGFILLRIYIHLDKARLAFRD